MNRNVTAKVKREQLIRDGYCVIENVLDDELLQGLRDATEKLIKKQTEEEIKAHRSMGSDIHIFKDPFFVKLILCPKALEALASLGFPNPKFTSGHIISKPPHSPRLFWHFDYAGWDDPGCFGETPQQLFLMYYLVDTTPYNGCLRVLPGSHRHDNPFHEELGEAHTLELRAGKNMDSSAFSSRPDEIDVPVKAGDLLIGDARLIHAAHANQSPERRTVITMWYFPDLEALSEREQAFYAGWGKTARMSEDLNEWPEHVRQLLEPMWPRYEGNAQPFAFNRIRPMRGE
ncbi:phytanoyl-CoA dioxygenase family protein [Paenibacillus montanisoli]|uniref:Phytanoyl-CoA dioxygenase family protein n=1 Tax=Paenibacillus montanisoli TaxID=2081970 RepID=A0A328UC05_9BACL|nr:phytanoyl-CoA dioxygenase family protein [Paenibacillus montanisoli]RAP78435.1 hypothetical protein DL346_08425 [Paenibacillus montanisoli]